MMRSARSYRRSDGIRAQWTLAEGWPVGRRWRHEMGTKPTRDIAPRDRFVLGLPEIDQTQVAVVGGKGAHLGELSHIDGVRVPGGFCVTTDAFRRMVADAPAIGDRLDQLSLLDP